MLDVDTENTVPKQAMVALDSLIRNLAPGDPSIYALTEAYAHIWLLYLEVDVLNAPRDTVSLAAIEPFIPALANFPALAEKRTPVTV